MVVGYQPAQALMVVEVLTPGGCRTMRAARAAPGATTPAGTCMIGPSRCCCQAGCVKIDTHFERAVLCAGLWLTGCVPHQVHWCWAVLLYSCVHTDMLGDLVCSYVAAPVECMQSQEFGRADRGTRRPHPDCPAGD
jgi:hypothetical protein